MKIIKDDFRFGALPLGEVEGAKHSPPGDMGIQYDIKS